MTTSSAKYSTLGQLLIGLGTASALASVFLELFPLRIALIVLALLLIGAGSGLLGAALKRSRYGQDS